MTGVLFYRPPADPAMRAATARRRLRRAARNRKRSAFIGLDGPDTMEALGKETVMRWLVNLIYDAEYGGYVADVPELPGCMSQGKTIEAALENVKEAIALYRDVEGDRRAFCAV